MIRVFVLGQAPPERDADVPYQRTRLWRWLATVGIDERSADWTFDALAASFPGSNAGGDVAPDKETITSRAPEIWRLIENVSPDLLIAVGALAGRFLVSEDAASLDDLVGRVIQVPHTSGASLPMVVLPHPSGRSTWLYMAHGRPGQLAAALREIASLVHRDGNDS